MNLDKHELQTLKHLAFYKLFAKAVMLAGILFQLFGLYVITFKDQTSGKLLLNIALTAASGAMMCCGYLMLFFLNIIDKFKQHYQDQIDTGT